MRGEILGTKDQFAERRQKVVHALAGLKLDGLLVTNLSNIRYLFNFTGSAAVALITPRGAHLIVDSRYITQAQQESPGVKVTLSTPRGNEEATSRLLRRLRPARLGFESRSVTYFTYSYFYHELRGKVKLAPTHFLVERIRTVKDRDEIEKIRQALKVTWETFDRLLPLVKPGITEKDLATELEYRLLRNGATKLSFDTIIASGYRSAMPHGKASEKKIGYREFVTFDFGIYMNGYASDMTRTVYVGKPPPLERRIYNTVREAVERAEAGVRPGLKGSDVDALARRFIRRKGFGKYFGHATGHGIGLDVHEQPFISTRGTEEVLPNMVFTIEPGIYIPGAGGVRIEDIIVLTESGCQVMTQYPRELIYL